MQKILKNVLQKILQNKQIIQIFRRECKDGPYEKVILKFYFAQDLKKLHNLHIKTRWLDHMLEVQWTRIGQSLPHFRNCPSLSPFWRSVQGVLETVFKREINLNFKIMYLGDMEELCLAKCDKYLLRVLLVACKKTNQEMA